MTIGTPTNNVANAAGDLVAPLPVPSAGTINVTAGELVVVPFARYSPTSDPIVVGDISTSGTATLGTWSLDNPRNGTTDGGSSYAATGHFSAIVTGSGTLAVSIGGNPATTYAHGGLISVPGNWDASRLETSAGPGAVSTGSVNVATDSMSSSGIGLFVGVAQVNTTLSSLGASANSTDIYRDLSPDTGASAYRISTGALSYAFSWTANTAAVFGASGVVYKEAAGASVALEDGSGWPLTQPQPSSPVVSLYG